MRGDASEICAVIPAAGLSRRFGADKRLVDAGEGPMLETVVQRCAGVFERVLVVLREDEGALARRLEGIGPGVQVEQVGRASGGIGDSIARGVLATRGSRAWFVALGDMPFVESRTLEALRDTMGERLRESSDAPVIVQPVCRDVAGHPVGFSHHFGDELIALRGDRGARALLQRNPAARIRVAVDDPGIHRDIDAPADLERAPSFNAPSASGSGPHRRSGDRPDARSGARSPRRGSIPPSPRE